MDLLRESRYIMRTFIIIIVCWFGWLCGLAFGQVGEAFTSAVNFPGIGLTCLANLAAFFAFILRGKHWYEKRAKKENLFIGKVKETNINGLKVMTTYEENLQKYSVVMLSFRYPATFGARKFMRIISNAYDVHSIFLQCGRLQCGAFTGDFRKCSCTQNRDGRCGCIVFNTVEGITLMLARRMPGTMKRLPHSQCLLPSLCCLRNGCHNCNKELLHVENDSLTEGEPHVQSPAAVCELLDQLESIPKVSACICIPLRSASDDEWTNELIRIFEPQDTEFRGVVFREGGTNVSSALENYKNGNRECDADETYSLASLAILPYLTEPLINFVLTFWLKVDGFSSIVLAGRSVSSHLSSSYHSCADGRQIFPHKHLTRACVKSNANNTDVCQVLFFRPHFQIYILHSLWIFSACICCIGWTLLVAMERGAHKWYHIPSMAPSEGRIIVIIVAISISLAMDVFDLKLYLQIRRRRCFRGSFTYKFIIFHKSFKVLIDLENIFWFSAIIGLQLLYIGGCIAIERVGGIKAFGRWIYSALQCLVLAKWLTFDFIFHNCQDALRQDSPEDGKAIWWYGSCGHYILASAFLLNATLAGVRAQWIFS